MADNFPHKHIIGYVHITPDLITDNKISTTDHSSYTLSSLFGVFAKNGIQAIDVCAETGTTYINGVDPVAAYAYSYNAIPQLENLINGKLNNYIKEHDVFHYGGTFTAGSDQGNFGTFSYLTNDSMVIVGTTVKVQNDGWFGNYHVHAGDLLISYNDSATLNSETYWDIIETHLGPLNSKGTYTQENKPNFLTNIYLNDNGDLSYSYSYFTQVHSYVNDGTASDLDNLDKDTNIITTVISNVNFDASGKFSYQLHNLTNSKSHHSQQKNDITYQAVITNLSLSSKGHLTYTASVLSSTSSTSGDITIGDTNNESFSVIDGISQSGNGSVSYHYKTITLSYNHHTTNTGVKDSEKNLTTESSVNVISGINLSESGELSYSYYEIPQIKQMDNQVQTSLFIGDNNVTYMMGISEGKITIDQPVKSVVLSNVAISRNNPFEYTVGDWLGSQYNFNNYKLNKSGDQVITINTGINATDFDIVYIKYNNTSTPISNESKLGKTISITLPSSLQQTITNTCGSGSFTNLGAKTWKASAAEKKLDFILEIPGNSADEKFTINFSYTLPAINNSVSKTPKANIYRCIGDPSSASVSATAVTSKPTSVTFSSGGDIKYIFPEVFGTPTFKQLNSPDSNWELKNTYSYSSSSFSGTTNKVNYKVYGVKNATASGGTWQISW